VIDGLAYAVSEEQREAFWRDGYAVLGGVLTEAELAPLEEAYMRFMRAEVEGMGRDFCDMSGPYSRVYEDFNIINALLPRVYDPALRGNIFERRAQSIAEQLIGGDATLDYDQFLSKKPGKPAARFAWHQDLGYWPTGTPDTRTSTCSLALDDASLENGCLRVVSGSHREPQLRAHKPLHGDTNRDDGHTLSVELEATDEVVALPVKRGDLTVHDERIVHGSGGNPSAKWRRTYIVAHRSRATVEYERSIGFTHSHNDEVRWTTHLGALEG